MNRMQEIEIAKIDAKITDSLHFMILGFAGALVAGILNILDCVGVVSVRTGMDSLVVYSMMYVISLAVCLLGFNRYAKLLELKSKIGKEE